MHLLPLRSSSEAAWPSLTARSGAAVAFSAGVSGKVNPAWNRRQVSKWLMVGIVALGLIWRLARLLAGYPIWYDEAFLALTWMTRDVAGLFRPPEYFQVAPIGFLVLERGMTVAFGPSALSLRIIPFVTGVASLVMFARVASRTLDRTSALLAVGIFAASYYPARHGAEIKPYAIDLLLALLTLDLGWSLWIDRASTRHWLMLSGVIAVGVWFSYPLIFVAGGVGLMLASRVARPWDRKSSAILLVMAVVSTASWLAMYVLVARPQAEATSFYTRSSTWKAAFPPTDRPWRLPGWLLDVHTGNMLAYPYGGKNFGSLATTILVALGCYSLRRHRSALAFLLLSPLLPTFLASVVRRYPYGTSARTMLFMAPSFCLLAGVGLARIIRRLFPGRRKIYATSSVTLGFGVAILATTIGNLALPYREVGDVENRRVIQELASSTRPGDLWIGYDGIRAFPDDEDLMIRRWIGQTAEIRYNLLAQATVPVRWMPDRIDDLSNPGRTWLIVHRSGYRGFDEAGLVGLQSGLARKLGAPIIHRYQMTPKISVVAYEYSPARTGPHSPGGDL